MPVRAGEIAFIDDCNGKYQIMAKVLKKERPVKGRKLRPAWEKAALLWGDVVLVRSIAGSKAVVSAKGHELEVPKARLSDQPILNIWQIDVGQGDGSLIRFPNGKCPFSAKRRRTKTQQKCWIRSDTKNQDSCSLNLLRAYPQTLFP